MGIEDRDHCGLHGLFIHLAETFLSILSLKALALSLFAQCLQPGCGCWGSNPQPLSQESNTLVAAPSLVRQPRSHGARPPSPTDVCWHAALPHQPAGDESSEEGGVGGGGGGRMKCHQRKCKLLQTSGAENMFCLTRGTLIFHKVK